MYDIESSTALADDAPDHSGRREHVRPKNRSHSGQRARVQQGARLADIIHVLALEQVEQDLFRGISRDIGTPQVFGGQVIAQSLAAACRTVSDRSPHSLHAYFLRRGDINAPIDYQVERARDGASFSSRRVRAMQHGEEILNMAVSFQRPEKGVEHQLAMPSVAPPENLMSARMLAADVAMPEKLRRILARDTPFEFRFVDPLHFMPGVESQCTQHLWFRAVGRLPDDASLHNCLLAYVSDYYLLTTALRGHANDLGSEAPLAVSIDHSIWFHRPVRMHEWLLYCIDSPSASGARGFTRASIFSREGELIASTAQEGLVRACRARRAPSERKG